jgi:hypothetical protein
MIYNIVVHEQVRGRIVFSMIGRKAETRATTTATAATTTTTRREKRNQKKTRKPPLFLFS